MNRDENVAMDVAALACCLELQNNSTAIAAYKRAVGYDFDATCSSVFYIAAMLIQNWTIRIRNKNFRAAFHSRR